MDIVLNGISVVLMVYLSKHLILLSRQLRENSHATKLRNAVDWTKPPERRYRSKPRSRFSDFLKF